MKCPVQTMFRITQVPFHTYVSLLAFLVCVQARARAGYERQN
jgi:hypothetical protein